MAGRPLFADELLDLHAAQELDHRRAQQQPHEQRRQARQRRAHGDVTENAKEPQERSGWLQNLEEKEIEHLGVSRRSRAAFLARGQSEPRAHSFDDTLHLYAARAFYE